MATTIGTSIKVEADKPEQAAKKEQKQKKSGKKDK